MYTSATLIQQKTGKTLTADEASLFDAIVGPAITEWINNYLGIQYDEATGQLIRHVNGGSAAVFIGPFSSIDRIEYVDPDTVTDGGDLFDPTEYYIEGGWLFTYSRRPFVPGVRNIRVTGSMATVPASITLAATMMATKVIQYKGAREVDSEKIGDYQITYSNLSTQEGVASLVDDNILTLLAPFKPIRLA